MIVITDIEVQEVDRYEWEMIHAGIPMAHEQGASVYANVDSEMIYGRDFVNNNGDRVCIGASEKVERAIGLPFEAFENLNQLVTQQRKNIKQLHHEIANKNAKLEEYEKASFWERLIYLATGKL